MPHGHALVVNFQDVAAAAAHVERVAILGWPKGQVGELQSVVLPQVHSAGAQHPTSEPPQPHIAPPTRCHPGFVEEGHPEHLDIGVAVRLRKDDGLSASPQLGHAPHQHRRPPMAVLANAAEQLPAVGEAEGADGVDRAPEQGQAAPRLEVPETQHAVGPGLGRGQQRTAPIQCQSRDLVCVAKEETLLPGFDVQDDNNCVARVHNSSPIRGPQGPFGAVTPKADDPLEPQDRIWEEASLLKTLLAQSCLR